MDKDSAFLCTLLRQNNSARSSNNKHTYSRAKAAIRSVLSICRSLQIADIQYIAVRPGRKSRQTAKNTAIPFVVNERACQCSQGRRYLVEVS
jgi:hypothetical protein